MTEQTFLLSHKWLVVLKDMGLDPGLVMRTAALPEGLLAQAEARVSVKQYVQFWLALEKLTREEAFSIRLVQSITPDAFHPIIFAALCSPSMSVAWRRLAKYIKIFGPLGLEIEETADTFSICIQWDEPGVQLPAILVAKELAFVTQFARIGTREHICPIRVESPCLLEPQETYTSFFGVTPQHGQKHQLVFKAEDAHRPFVTEHQTVWDVFEPALKTRLAKVEGALPVSTRVRSILLKSLPHGDASIQTTARSLGLSSRTLQRRLREEGSSHKSIVRSTREKLARHYLTNTTLTYAEISFLLGFEEPTSFFRAFRGWTGETPEDTRLSVH